MKAAKKKKQQAPMLQIGSSAETVAAAEKAVMEILFCPAGSKEKIAALEALGRICNVNGTAVSNCSFTTSE